MSGPLHYLCDGSVAFSQAILATCLFSFWISRRQQNIWKAKSRLQVSAILCTPYEFICWEKICPNCVLEFLAINWMQLINCNLVRSVNANPNSLEVNKWIEGRGDIIQENYVGAVNWMQLVNCNLVRSVNASSNSLEVDKWIEERKGTLYKKIMLELHLLRRSLRTFCARLSVL
jgi:hypothetical protein